MSFHAALDSHVCVVCLDVTKEPCTVNPCGHKFDRKCIKEWLLRMPCCPVCRTSCAKLVDTDGTEIWTQESFSLLRRTPSPRARRALALRRDLQPTEETMTRISESLEGEQVLLCLRLLVEIAVHSTLLNLTEVLVQAIIQCIHVSNTSRKQPFSS